MVSKFGKDKDEANNKNLATKADIFLLELKIESVKVEIESVKVEIEKSKNSTIKWLGLIITLATTIIWLLITRYHG